MKEYLANPEAFAVAAAPVEAAAADAAPAAAEEEEKEDSDEDMVGPPVPCLSLLHAKLFTTGLRSFRLIGCIGFVLSLFTISEIYAIP